jgi:hypothetical protein
VFKSSFSRDQRSAAAERLHAQVDTYLVEPRSVGENVPHLAGRALCVQWMNDQWLFRTIGERAGGVLAHFSRTGGTRPRPDVVARARADQRVAHQHDPRRAFTLLRDAALLLELKSDLQTILEHPFAAALTAAEQRDFRGAVTIIRRGIDDVLAQRSRLTTTLRDHIVNHDVIRDRELDATLRQINQQLAV